MDKNYNPIEYIDNKEREFTQEMLSDTIKYQKKYGFGIGENNSAHNNEADAFRHAYMQSMLAHRYGTLSAKIISSNHEYEGNKNGQDPRESNMDLWNNQQGQQIYNEIRLEDPNFNKLSEQRQKDIIAQKVVQRMRAGQLITNPDDPRKFEEEKPSYIPTRGVGGIQNNGQLLGFAANIDEPKTSLFNYTNPITGNNRIFTREDINEMTNEEFAEHEKEIDAQIRAMKGFMPTNNDLENEAQNSGGVVYVHSYTRSDGTEVKGYYRSRPSFN